MRLLSKAYSVLSAFFAVKRSATDPAVLRRGDLASSQLPAKERGGGLAWALLLFIAVLSLFFFKSCLPGQVHFSNDGPLGAMSSRAVHLPEAFSGIWGDLNSVGFFGGHAGATSSYGLRWLLGPVGYAKFYAPLSLLLLGLGAWCFFRQTGLTPLACSLGGLAAMLNSTFFSVAAWGLGSHAIAVAMSFFAVAALSDTASRRRWLRVALAGLAVGMGVAEGADSGALLSLFVAAFVIYQAFTVCSRRGEEADRGEPLPNPPPTPKVPNGPNGPLSPTLSPSEGEREKRGKADFGPLWRTDFMGTHVGGYGAWQISELVRRFAVGLLRVAVVAVFAGLLAAQTITSLVATNIKGVVGMEQDAATRAERWDWATQWSMPKLETLGLMVPGLFGYRMDAPGGGNYWGAMGRAPAWDRYFQNGEQGPRPMAMLRYSGGGNYAGILVLAVALWAVCQSFRKQHSGLQSNEDASHEPRASAPTPTAPSPSPHDAGVGRGPGRGASTYPKDSSVGQPGENGLLSPALSSRGGEGEDAGVPIVGRESSPSAHPPVPSRRDFSPGEHTGTGICGSESPVFLDDQRKLIWFWAGVAVVSLLLAFGRFAPFYQLFYAFPYASTMRNPVKFLYPLQCALVVLFAYGVHGLSRGYLRRQAAPLANRKAFPLLTVIVFEASLLALIVYGLTRNSLVAYLQKVDFDATEASVVASFSFRQAGWFILYLALGLGLLTLVLRGFFTGRIGGLLLGLFLVLDLGRADSHWVLYWNYPRKYASDAVIDLLREKPYEHRVAIWPLEGPPSFLLLDQLYRIEWLPHLFPYYNIQSLDLVQMGRKPLDFAAYEQALQFDHTSNTVHRIARRWQLTNTRYLLATSSLLEVLNQQIDPLKHRFRAVTNFDIAPRAGLAQATRAEDLTVIAKPRGQYALIEFTGALPRAQLYSQWQLSTNDQDTLHQLASPAFDPEKTVLVASASQESKIQSPKSKVQVSKSADDGQAGRLPDFGLWTSDSGLTLTRSVQFVSYAPKHLVLKAVAEDASVLLLNDRFDPNWKVQVDGRPETLLRCNYLMRGVYLRPGAHTVEFRFEHGAKVIYVSLAAIVLGLLLGGLLLVWKEPSASGHQ